MNAHDSVYDVVFKARMPLTAPIIQSGMSPKLSYATVHSILNDLVRQGKLAEGSNEVGKRTFKVR